ncbi:MAG: DUF1059 domain-containing protein [Burkholderiaceae bacterium]
MSQYTLKCRDVGFDCDGVVRADTPQAVLAQAAEHARSVHKVEISPQQAVEVEKLIRRDDQV